MGGDRFRTHHSSFEDDSSVDQDFSGHANNCAQSCKGVFDESGELVRRNSPTSLAFEVNRRRNYTTYAEVLATYYDDLQNRSESLTEAKNKILSYTPGSWIDKVGGFESGDYRVPKTTSLLLIGPKGSGKSSLLNNISRFFENDKFMPERAQVSNGYSERQGTFFVQEYMIPRGSHSFCLYDTRGLSDDSTENKKVLERWLTRGVRHGELVQRASNDTNFNSMLNRPYSHISGVVKAVNFVVVVVNGVSVLESLDSDDEGKKQYTEMIKTIFEYPFLSFKDDLPVIVVTHGDLLSVTDRVRVRIRLGNLLGIPPKTQILDIPGKIITDNKNSKMTELAIVDLLSHCLDRADKNLPLKMNRLRLFIERLQCRLSSSAGVAGVNATTDCGYCTADRVCGSVSSGVKKR